MTAIHNRKKRTLSRDLRGKRLSRVHFRTTKQVSLNIDKRWDKQKYPDTARLRPSPQNPKIHVEFKTRAEYIEFCLRALNNMGSFHWTIFSENNNPDHPEFWEEVTNVR